MKQFLTGANYIATFILLAAFVTSCRSSIAQGSQTVATGPQRIILDTDIGDDIDDAFALGLAFSSPKVQLVGVTTAWGNTDLRARLAARLLAETGHSGAPVAVGPKSTVDAARFPFTQARWATQFPAPQYGWPNAVDFILDAIRKNPGQITLIGIAPFRNVGALIDKDPGTFRELKRVIIMGGSIHRGYGDLGYLPDHGPVPEYNVLMDIPAAQKLFASGVPIYEMPMDSTQDLKLDLVLRNILFSQGTPLSDALTLLYHQWTASTRIPAPTLWDAMAVAYAIDPTLCPTQPMHIVIDDQGYTRVAPGHPNVNVCLHSDSDRFFHFYISTILGERRSQSSH